MDGSEIEAMEQVLESMKQAIDLGVGVLAVACPYCMSMFKDSQLTVDKGETIAVKDIAELVKEAI